jgi:hypothetical protein
MGSVSGSFLKRKKTPNALPGNKKLTVTHSGKRALTRTAAVAALKTLGFGKTAAYKALSMDGRFVTLLQFAPDGTIT